MLAKLGILTEVDGTAFALYCDAYGRWVEYGRKVSETGPVIKRGGWLGLNPYVALKQQAFSDMRRMLGEFGITPSSRSRVVAAAPLADDDDGNSDDLD
jgi:P27 family predicted phage terminase small subunit